MSVKIGLSIAEDVVRYYNANESTVRKTSEHFEIGKSTVHNIPTKVLPNETSERILKKNKSEAPSRGGKALKNKYRKERST